MHRPRKPLTLALAAVAAVLSVGVSIVVSAEKPSPTPPPLTSVDEIVARHIAAVGGLDKIRAIKTLREQGRITAGADRQALALRERKRPDRTRFELTTQGVTAVFVSNGDKGWKVSPFDSDVAPTPLPEEAVAEAAEQADIEGPLVDWKQKGHRVELVGTETVRGREAYKLKLTLASGGERYELIDASTMLRTRTVSTRTVKGRPLEIETTYSDYKKIGGVQFPHRIEVVAHGRPQALLVVLDKIEVNPPIADSRFEMPTGAAATGAK
jgi:outer membrane lipoprotein-sorting protein